MRQTSSIKDKNNSNVNLVEMDNVQEKENLQKNPYHLYQHKEKENITSIK